VAENPGFQEAPRHVFRRVGAYVLGALEFLLEELDADKVTVSEMLQREWS
jgi:hypothetical protein